jgi:hypothetical protein
MIPLLNNPFRLNQISIGEHPYGTRSRDRIQDRKEERTQGADFRKNTANKSISLLISSVELHIFRAFKSLKTDDSLWSRYIYREKD